MKIVVSNHDEVPIYEQIKRQILDAILSGALSPGDALPSLRALSRDLAIGVLTVNRAYAELESEGYVENIQGKGCYVAQKSAALLKEHLLADASDKMAQAISLAQRAGQSDEEMRALFNQCLRRRRDG